MTFIEFYKKKCAERGFENVIEVQNQAKNKDQKLIFKIQNHIDRFNLYSDVEYFLTQIKNNFDFASMFAKTPSRQNSSEKFQIEFLNSKGIKARNLGNDKFRIDGAKSLDFYLPNSGKYVFAKVTNEKGGGQDNQYADILKFIKSANNHPNIEFVVLADGNYYGEKEIKEMKELANENIIITNSDKYTE